MKKLTKLKIAEFTDPICPNCKIAMFAVSAMLVGKDKQFKHYAECPDCGLTTEGK